MVYDAEVFFSSPLFHPPIYLCGGSSAVQDAKAFFGSPLVHILICRSLQDEVEVYDADAFLCYMWKFIHALAFLNYISRGHSRLSVMRV